MQSQIKKKPFTYRGLPIIEQSVIADKTSLALNKVEKMFNKIQKDRAKRKPIKLRKKELKPGEKVFFKAYDTAPGGKNLGHAEFVVCIQYRNNKMRDIWIYPQQQRNVKYYYHFKASRNSEC